MKRAILCLAFTVAFNFYCTNVAWADEISELKQQIKAMQKQIEVMQKKIEILEAKKEVKKAPLVKYIPGEGIEVKPAGLKIGADATFIVQGTPNANNAGSGEDSICDISWKGCIEIEKEFDDWGLAFMELETGQNDGLEGELSLFSNVNANACNEDAKVAISKILYEHYFFNKQLTLTAGKIDALDYMEQNEYRDDDKTQFLAHIFKHSPSIEGPSDNAIGLHANICVEPIKFVEFDAGIFEADADWDDVFDHMFYMAQINVKLAELLRIDPDEWNGNCRFYMWINDRFHEKLVDKGGNPTEDHKQQNYGFGISCDQMITDVVGIFGSFSWQRPDILAAGVTAADIANNPTLEWSWSAGAQIAGAYWNRVDDVFAFAIGQTFPSEEWDDASSDAYGKGEGHIEAYYRCQINECLTISPDIQIIWNPNGVSKSSEGDDDMIFVYGVRGQVDF